MEIDRSRVDAVDDREGPPKGGEVVERVGEKRIRIQ